MTNRGPSFLRRYKWNDLTEPEKEAVSDSLEMAATRAAAGVGVVLTLTAIISNARRGKPPLPPFLKYGSITFFTLTGAYIGVLSALPTYARRILSVPESKLADDLRTTIGDWQTRVPATTTSEHVPHEALPDREKPGSATNPPPVRRAHQSTQ